METMLVGPDVKLYPTNCHWKVLADVGFFLVPFLPVVLFGFWKVDA